MKPWPKQRQQQAGHMEGTHLPFTVVLQTVSMAKTTSHFSLSSFSCILENSIFVLCALNVQINFILEKKTRVTGGLCLAFASTCSQLLMPGGKSFMLRGRGRPALCQLSLKPDRLGLVCLDRREQCYLKLGGTISQHRDKWKWDPVLFQANCHVACY